VFWAAALDASSARKARIDACFMRSSYLRGAGEVGVKINE
jgi:hypothetical protein